MIMNTQRGTSILQAGSPLCFDSLVYTPRIRSQEARRLRWLRRLSPLVHLGTVGDVEVGAPRAFAVVTSREFLIVFSCLPALAFGPRLYVIFLADRPRGMLWGMLEYNSGACCSVDYSRLKEQSTERRSTSRKLYSRLKII